MASPSLSASEAKYIFFPIIIFLNVSIRFYYFEFDTYFGLKLFSISIDNSVFYKSQICP